MSNADTLTESARRMGPGSALATLACPGRRAKIGALTFPLPLWERVGPHEVRRRVRGCLLTARLERRIETLHPALRATFSHKGRRKKDHRPLKFATLRSAVALTPSLKSSVARRRDCSASS